MQPDLTDEHPDVVALGSAGRALVLDLVAELAEDDLCLDAKETRLLLEAARHLDLAVRISAELAEGDLIVLGSTGQPRVSPLVDSVDKARRTVAQLLAHVAKGNREEAAQAAAKARTKATTGYAARIGA